MCASDAYRLSSQLNVASFPFIAVLSPQGNQLAVVYHRSGAGLTGPTASADGLLAELVQTMDTHRHRITARQTKKETVARDRQLIAAQDREYREALEADRAKQAAAKAAEKAAAEQRETNRKLAEEKAKAEAIAATLQREREAKLHQLQKVSTD